jgi:hypothetical protein
MLALRIILGIVLVLVLLGCIPVAVTARYDGEGPLVYGKVGPVKLRLYPRAPAKPQESKKQGKQKLKKTKKTQAPKEKKARTSMGGRLPLFRELLGLVLEVQVTLRNYLKIRNLELCLTVGGRGEDPAKAAILYGRAWAAIGALLPQLERVFIIQKREVQAQIDFLSEETTVFTQATAVISVGALVKMAVYYGIRGLKIFLRHRKKGGKTNGTSHQ